jgi:hypothetical protein
MAYRGSGIGASMTGGLGSGMIGGSATSLRTANAGQVYGPAAAPKLAVHHFLWVMVLLEIAALVALRHAFRHYHGG